MLVVDCADCVARGPACSDCVVSVLLGSDAGESATLSTDEQRAVAVLASSGLVPPLRMRRSRAAERSRSGSVPGVGARRIAE